MTTRTDKNRGSRRFRTRNGALIAFVTGLILLIISSCSTSPSPDRYLEKFEKQKAKQCVTINRNGITASVLAMPARFFAARDARFDTTLSMETAEKRYSNSLFFALGIRPDSQAVPGSFLLTKGGYAEFKNNVMRNNFGREDDIFLLYKNDTVRVAGVQYTRDWGMMNEDQFLLTFTVNHMKQNANKYRLIIREIAPELGTIDIPVKKLKSRV